MSKRTEKDLNLVKRWLSLRKTTGPMLLNDEDVAAAMLRLLRKIEKEAKR